MLNSRESNIELLRIVAMFFVLLVHINFFSLGAPDIFELHLKPLDSTSRVFFQSLTIACVDIFVFISGWFGIKPKVKAFLSLIFQCLFFFIALYIVALILEISNFSITGILGCLAATKSNWFIKSYVLLYILSPVLNEFIKNVSRVDFKNVLISFFIFQFVYGWIFRESTAYIQDGHSITSFIGLYLLARYVHIYKPAIFDTSVRNSFLIVFALVLFVTFVYIILPHICGLYGIGIGMRLLNYISPTTILITIYTVVAFSKLKIQSHLINWFAASSFSIYLLHTNPNVIDHYTNLFCKIHSTYDGLVYWAVSIPILIGIFVLTILIDQIRIAIWRIIEKYSPQIIHR